MDPQLCQIEFIDTVEEAMSAVAVQEATEALEKGKSKPNLSAKALKDLEDAFVKRVKKSYKTAICHARRLHKCQGGKSTCDYSSQTPNDRWFNLKGTRDL